MDSKIRWTKMPISKERYVKVGFIDPPLMNKDGFMSSIAVKFVRWSKTQGCLIVDRATYSKEAFNAMQAGFREIFGSID